MIERLELFRRHVLLWAAPLALVAVNVVWLSAFGSGARLRAADLESRLQKATGDHAEVASRLADRERLWIAATENRERTAALYRDRFSTERGRLTNMVREIKQLAARAGLEPQSISYPEERLEEYGLVRRSFVFGVEGSYSQLRTFLNLLEMSPSFVSVERIQVGERNGGLGVALRLSTLFEAAPAETAPGARR